MQQLEGHIHSAVLKISRMQNSEADRKAKRKVERSCIESLRHSIDDNKHSSTLLPADFDFLKSAYLSTVNRKSPWRSERYRFTDFASSSLL